MDRIEREGAPALSLRAVARDIAMSPAGLYRYYDGRDELLTDLLTDAYAELAATVEEAAGGTDDPMHRFRAAVNAYRRWALDDPNRFLLVFGTPVPGYAAPEGGPTVEANKRMGRALFVIAADAWAQGLLARPETSRTPGDHERELAAEIQELAPDFPVGLVPVLIGTWARWHGLVILEVTHQLHWLYPEPDTFFADEVERMVAELTG